MAVDVAKLIKQAAEAAKLVPEHLQEAAFNRAYETLLAGAQKGQSQDRTTIGESPSAARRKSAKKSSGQDGVGSLDRTAHPEINHNGTALVNSLRLLRAAKVDLDIDGLSASAIAKVLNDKFRCGVSRRAVSRALNDASQYVNRHKDGKAVIFRLMGPGEEYLTSLNRVEETEEPVGSAAKGATKRKSRTPKKKTPTAKKNQGKSSAKSKTTRGGPAAAMGKLLESGYFSDPRTIGEIIEKLKHDQGRTFKSNELSPVLVRWLRAEKLSRTQNAEGQYEYTAT